MNWEYWSPASAPGAAVPVCPLPSARCLEAQVASLETRVPCSPYQVTSFWLHHQLHHIPGGAGRPGQLSLLTAHVSCSEKLTAYYYTLSAQHKHGDSSRRSACSAGSPTTEDPSYGCAKRVPLKGFFIHPCSNAHISGLEWSFLKI